jgi:BCD family chlorophyll transporter-like MFS transporter
MCTMLLLGMAVSALLFGALLADFSQLRLIKVIQGTAVATMLLNITALWKQEARNTALTAPERELPGFRDSWRNFSSDGRALRRLVALGIGTVAFGMQDILLEPYGGEVLKLSVSATTLLTAILAATGIGGFVVAARALARQFDPYRIASFGALAGLVGMTSVFLAAPLETVGLFVTGVAFIGFGGGLFAHSTLTAAMSLAPAGQVGLALGVWGAVQATASGGAIAASGMLRDGVNALAASGQLGVALNHPATGYGVVYQIEIILLFATLVAIGPLVRSTRRDASTLPGAALLPGFRRNTFSQEVLP